MLPPMGPVVATGGGHGRLPGHGGEAGGRVWLLWHLRGRVLARSTRAIFKGEVGATRQLPGPRARPQAPRRWQRVCRQSSLGVGALVADGGGGSGSAPGREAWACSKFVGSHVGQACPNDLQERQGPTRRIGEGRPPLRLPTPPRSPRRPTANGSCGRHRALKTRGLGPLPREAASRASRCGCSARSCVGWPRPSELPAYGEGRRRCRAGSPEASAAPPAMDVPAVVGPGSAGGGAGAGESCGSGMDARAGHTRAVFRRKGGGQGKFGTGPLPCCNARRNRRRSRRSQRFGSRRVGRPLLPCPQRARAGPLPRGCGGQRNRLVAGSWAGRCTHGGPAGKVLCCPGCRGGAARTAGKVLCAAGGRSGSRAGHASPQSPRPRRQRLRRACPKSWRRMARFGPPGVGGPATPVAGRGGHHPTPRCGGRGRGRGPWRGPPVLPRMSGGGMAWGSGRERSGTLRL
jgi:hypothetical protein